MTWATPHHELAMCQYWLRNWYESLRLTGTNTPQGKFHYPRSTERKLKLREFKVIQAEG